MKKLILIYFVLLAVSLLRAGTETHGTETKTDQHNPWFLGDEAIPFCLKVDPKGPYTIAEFRQLVLESVADWKTFFAKYGMDKLKFGMGFPPKMFPDLNLRGLSLNFEEISECTDISKQIQIQLSTKPDREPFWESTSSTVFGAATRESYNHNTYRTGGRIWIHDFKDQKERPPVATIKHLLLHELGHVFGMRHNEVWVMYENAATSSIGENELFGKIYSEDLGKIEVPGWSFEALPGDSIRFGGSYGAKGKCAPIIQALGGGVSYHRVEMNLLSYTGGVAQYELRFSPKIAEQKAIFLKGTFEKTLVNPAESHGPGLYTHWLFQAKAMLMGSKTHRSEQLLTRSGGPSKWNGYFEMNGLILPATIEYGMGTTLRVFIPSEKRWIEFTAPRWE